ncbi:uncharacterized protein Z518_11102 [Rhinocladiella mackenziei CBS 650.93]|uniref:D-xylose 1-dehydrogenase (NADP(+), D-xylono-1,5-lactone-forming) n=1 Tax=Rhinocladiella mackenziei CBS 650.93 TaxID=1442369 RepID=A0A0D2ISE7_9EURO|nr:uncharacterized protein Z518_11102 [Rhinocladiella mackenziei CBS 650.93]KIW99689.1 hypothetical protein Z518_11102 [Rhinocladiella mackenziei CBS 650.93]
MADTVPTIRWGIVATGLVSSWFVDDLLLDRPDAKAKHVIQCIGGSSIEKCKDFAAKHCSKASPTLYASYEEVYADKNVDCVYIGTPHAFHKKNCLDAIAAGKNVLCEKAFTLNAREAREVVDAAKKKGVYLHEAMWLRHRPLVAKLRKLLHEEKAIGDVYRMWVDFGQEVNLEVLPEASRYKDLRLGAGCFLDMGIYSLTWAVLTLDPGAPHRSERPSVLAVQTHQGGIDITTSMLLQYPSTGRHGIVTCSTVTNGDPDIICRVEGTQGFVEVEGQVGSMPLSFTVYPKREGNSSLGTVKKPQGKRYDFPRIGLGFVYEADDTALDIAAGRKESMIMPLAESVRVMEIMDLAREQGGTRYPQDDE